MSVRAAIVFPYILLLFRIMPRKLFSGSSALDIGVLVLIGSSLSRALTGNAALLPTLAATGALVAMYVALSALARRSELVSVLVKGRRLTVIEDGRVNLSALRGAQLGVRDLEEQLRLKGVRQTGELSRAYLERNGGLSVFKEPVGDRHPPRE